MSLMTDSWSLMMQGSALIDEFFPATHLQLLVKAALVAISAWLLCLFLCLGSLFMAFMSATASFWLSIIFLFLMFFTFLASIPAICLASCALTAITLTQVYQRIQPTILQLIDSISSVISAPSSHGQDSELNADSSDDGKDEAIAKETLQVDDLTDHHELSQTIGPLAQEKKGEDHQKVAEEAEPKDNEDEVDAFGLGGELLCGGLPSACPSPVYKAPPSPPASFISLSPSSLHKTPPRQAPTSSPHPPPPTAIPLSSLDPKSDATTPPSMKDNQSKGSSIPIPSPSHSSHSSPSSHSTAPPNAGNLSVLTNQSQVQGSASKSKIPRLNALAYTAPPPFSASSSTHASISTRPASIPDSIQQQYPPQPAPLSNGAKAKSKGSQRKPFVVQVRPSSAVSSSSQGSSITSDAYGGKTKKKQSHDQPAAGLS